MALKLSKLGDADLQEAARLLEQTGSVSCLEVAHYLRGEVVRRQLDRQIRSIARKVGCTVAYARKYLLVYETPDEMRERGERALIRAAQSDPMEVRPGVFVQGSLGDDAA